MNEIGVEELIERVKDIISPDYPGEKIKARHVAEAFGVDPRSVAQWKTRGFIPADRILEFCHKRWINVNALLWNQPPGMQDAPRFFGGLERIAS
jgi:hypothetical protein